MKQFRSVHVSDKGNTLPEVEEVEKNSEENENFNKTTHFRVEEGRTALISPKAENNARAFVWSLFVRAKRINCSFS